ncbi:hypothetical protein [Streptomyces prasinopilosus]|uniref:Uncharacterized protein n=1 Tax=Streptomyces prasinopilosus TaxID=67344 RepID=A0A1G6SD37_9ACTN|nr:hypothetical protein [Streptomyces prasinopilosus]SDD14584.1 hypothetical protein SAMN05216505_105279 [Streptomyces prasinopilosus]
MNDAFTVEALWAWYGKEAGSLAEYDVLHCTGGAPRRAVFSEYIITASLGNPPPATAARDRLPWISVVGLPFTDQLWTGIAVMETSTLRDGANRAVVPTRYLLMDSAELVRRRVEYTTLWDAVAPVRLPPEHDETVLLKVSPPAVAGLTEGLETIADHTPAGTGGTAGAGQRREAAVEWAVSVAALLLCGDPVVVTGGGALDARARLAVFDAVAGLLPYGTRSGLRVGSCLDGGAPPPTQLAFGPGHTPSARCVRLGTPPQVPAGPPEDYRRRLSRLIEVVGFDTVTAGLRELDAPVAPADHGALLGALGRLDPFRAAVDAVEAGRHSAQVVAEGLNSLTDGEDADRDGFLRLVECGIAYAADPGGRELHEALRRHWTHRRSGPRVSALVAEALLNVVLSGAEHAMDSTSCRTRLDALWQLAERCRKEGEVLRLLPGRPDDGRRLRYAAECLCLLGPDRVADGRADAVRALRDSRRLTLEVLARESADPVRLVAWLTPLAPAAPEAPAWLRAWAVLSVREARHAARAEPRPTAEDAVHVLTATVGAGRPDWTAEAVGGLWPQLCTLATGSVPGSGDGGRPGADGATAGFSRLPRTRNRGGARKPSPPGTTGTPDMPEVPGRPPASAGPAAPFGPPDVRTLRALLTADPDAWQHCRAPADVLSCLVGVPPAGPPWRETACLAYARSLHQIFQDADLAPFLDLLVGELAGPALAEPWGKEGEPAVLAALLGAPHREAAADLSRRLAARDEEHRRRQAARERERAVRAQRLSEREAAHTAHLRATRRTRENQAVRQEAPERYGGGPPATTGTTGPGTGPAPAPTGLRTDHGRPPAVGTARPGGEPDPLERLEHAARLPCSSRDMAALWAPFTLDLESAAGRRALVAAGRWWEKARDGERAALFGHLHRALLAEHQCSVDVTADILHEIRRLVVAGRASGHSGGGWQAGPVLQEAKRDLRALRARVRELRWIRLRAHVNLAPGTPRKSGKRNRGSTDR